MRNHVKRSAFSPRNTLLACLFVCAVTCLVAFLLPFIAPPALVLTVSASYVAGFNNKIAIFGVALISAAVALWSWLRSDSPASDAETLEPSASLATRTIVGVITLSCLFFATAGVLVARSHLRYIADAGYFLEQMSAHSESGKALYTQLEFAYGPLLFYPTVWLHQLLRTSWTTVYFVSLAINQSVGILLLAYVLNQLPIRTRHKQLALILFGITALNPLLGLNYTFARFAAPFAALLFATRLKRVWQVTAGLALGQLLQLSISPELGAAFFFASFCWIVLQAWRIGPRWLSAAAGPLLGAAVFLLTIGASYTSMLRSFSRGALNLPVAPYPHILIFLFALVWLVPRAVGTALSRQSASAPQVFACYALSLGLLPAAFGRSDPLHVFFNGLGVLVLSLVGIQHLSSRTRAAWIASLLLFAGWVQFVNNSLYLDRTVANFRLAAASISPGRWRARLVEAPANEDPDFAALVEESEYRLDTHALEQQVGGDPVATPLEVSLATEHALKRSGKYVVDYYAFFVDIMNDLGEQRKIRSLNTRKWALLPADWDGPFLETPQNIDGVQGFAFPYRQRHAIPYNLGAAFMANIDAHWVEVQRFGPYMLYRNTAPQPE